MSRIGREPVNIPAGVDFSIADGNVVTVKGPLGTLCETFSPAMTLTKDGSVVTVARPNDEKEMRAIHGLTRALIQSNAEIRGRQGKGNSRSPQSFQARSPYLLQLRGYAQSYERSGYRHRIHL